MRRLVFLYLIISVLMLSIQASYGDYGYDGIHSDVGKTFFPFLKRGYDARSISMGGTSVGMPNDIYGVLSNPASLGFLDEMQAMISYTPVVLDIRGGTLAFALPYKSYGVYAANLIYLSCGVFEPVDEFGNRIEGTLNPYSIAGSVSWSKIIMETLSLGVTIKGIYERLSEGIEDEINKCSADGFAVDIGVQYRIQSSRLIYGLLLQNIGFIRSSYSEDTEKTELPLSFTTGFSYVFKNFPSVRVALDLEKATDDFLQYKLGLELNLYKQSFFLRGGYNFSQSDLEEFFSMIKNGSFDKDYQKTNWSLFSVGTGIKSDIKDIYVNMDIGFNFRVDIFDPAFALSLLIGF